MPFQIKITTILFQIFFFGSTYLLNPVKNAERIGKYSELTTLMKEYQDTEITVEMVLHDCNGYDTWHEIYQWEKTSFMNFQRVSLKSLATIQSQLPQLLQEDLQEILLLGQPPENMSIRATCDEKGDNMMLASASIPHAKIYTASKNHLRSKSASDLRLLSYS